MRQVFVDTAALVALGNKQDDWHDRAVATKKIGRITLDPAIIGGKPCIRRLRVTVGTLLGLMATGISRERILLPLTHIWSPMSRMQRSPTPPGDQKTGIKKQGQTTFNSECSPT
jgi:hypothetical protein